MKRLFSILSVLPLLFFSSTVFAVDGTANITANYTTPITVQEIQPLQFTLIKKPGATGTNVSISNMYNELNSTKQYFSGVSGYQVGCFKITGNPNALVRVTIQSNPTLTGSRGGSISFTAGPRGASASSCATSFPGSVYSSNVNGTGNVALSASGETYILWDFGSDTNKSPFWYAGATISSLDPDTYTGTVTVTVNYN